MSEVAASEILSALKNPFPANELQWRKQGKAQLAYIDARAVMKRLDEVVGMENWRDEYEAEPPRTVRKTESEWQNGKKVVTGHYNEQICGRVICKLSIRINGEWITKSDGAGETNVEGEKGGMSDAFKRAAVKFGIGRYLYYLKNVTPNNLPQWALPNQPSSEFIAGWEQGMKDSQKQNNQ